jgi:uncharacterized membrane protein
VDFITLTFILILLGLFSFFLLTEWMLYHMAKYRNVPNYQWFIFSLIIGPLVYFWIKKYPIDESIPKNHLYTSVSNKAVLANLILIVVAILYAVIYGMLNPSKDTRVEPEDSTQNRICVNWDQDTRGGFCTEYEFID